MALALGASADLGTGTARIELASSVPNPNQITGAFTHHCNVRHSEVKASAKNIETATGIKHITQGWLSNVIGCAWKHRNGVCASVEYIKITLLPALQPMPSPVLVLVLVLVSPAKFCFTSSPHARASTPLGDLFRLGRSLSLVPFVGGEPPLLEEDR